MARYKDAVTWIISNDDTTRLDGKPGTAGGQSSIAAAMIADLWGKTEAEVRAPDGNKEESV